MTSRSDDGDEPTDPAIVLGPELVVDPGPEARERLKNAPLLGDIDPEGAARAEAARTPDCKHPPVAQLTALLCSKCGVWVMDGVLCEIERNPDPEKHALRARALMQGVHGKKSN